MAAITIKNRAGWRQTVDAAVDAYLDWRDDCLLVAAAYSAWADASRIDRALRFDVYQRALDREECTANAYAELIRSVGQPVDIDLACQLVAIPIDAAAPAR
ncbi:MAG TPA: hypothetical protein VNZ01_06640 [Solirubrobacteraceae bacterium]|jgi:hypothetical protein|nr:hypothetical protein [Solirubrobacteraceae bacterium]